MVTTTTDTHCKAEFKSWHTKAQQKLIWVQMKWQRPNFMYQYLVHRQEGLMKKYQVDNFNLDMPPPGAYDISHSFELMKVKGRIENTGVLASHCKREIFKGFCA